MYFPDYNWFSCQYRISFYASRKQQESVANISIFLYHNIGKHEKKSCWEAFKVWSGVWSKMNQPLNIYADGCRGGVQMFGDMVTTWHYDIGDRGERTYYPGPVTPGHVTAVTDASRGSGSGIMIERDGVITIELRAEWGQICSEIGRQRALIIMVMEAMAEQTPGQEKAGEKYYSLLIKTL